MTGVQTCALPISRLILSHPISSYFTLYHLILPHATLSQFTAPHLITSHLTPSHLTSPHFTLSHLTLLNFTISYHLFSLHFALLYFNLSHFTSPHLTPSHPNSPHSTSITPLDRMAELITMNLSSNILMKYRNCRRLNVFEENLIQCCHLVTTATLTSLPSY